MDSNPETSQSGQTRTIKYWNDGTCHEISNRDCFPEHVLDLDVQKKVIERFLNFYLSGKVPKGLSVADLVFSVISIMPPHRDTEELIWSEQEYSKEGTLFTLPPDDIQQAEIKITAASSSSNNKLFASKNDQNKPTEIEVFDNQISSKLSSHIKAKPNDDANKTIEKCSTSNEKLDISKTSSKSGISEDTNPEFSKCISLLSEDNQQADKKLISVLDSSKIEDGRREQITETKSMNDIISQYVKTGHAATEAKEKLNGKQNACTITNYSDTIFVSSKQNPNESSLKNYEISTTSPNIKCSTCKDEKETITETKTIDDCILQNVNCQVSIEYAEAELEAEIKLNKKLKDDSNNDNTRPVHLKQNSNKLSKNVEKLTMNIDQMKLSQKSNNYHVERSGIENLQPIEVPRVNQSCEKIGENAGGALKILPDTKWSGSGFYPRFLPYRIECCAKRNAAFISTCHQHLINWDKRKFARIKMKFFFGILALISMRGITKGYKHIASFYTSFKMGTFAVYADEFYNYNYAVPNKLFVGACQRKFSKMERNTVIMFAKIIVYALIRSDEIPVQRFERKRAHDVSVPDFVNCRLKINVLKSALVAYTVNFKLELVSMMQGIKERFGTEGLNVVIEVTYCEETAESWRRFKEYFNIYLAPDSTSRTHPWARVFDEAYFRDLSCADNYPLALILAVFTAEITGNKGIWLSKWIDSNKKEILEKYKEIGHRMFIMFLKECYDRRFIGRTLRELIKKNDALIFTSPPVVLSNEELFIYLESEESIYYNRLMGC